MYIYTTLCRYWITLYRYVLVFIVPHVDIELEDNKQFISNIPRIFAEKMWEAFAKATHIFSAKNMCELDIVLTRTVNILTTDKLFKLMMLWTIGPWFSFFSKICVSKVTYRFYLDSSIVSWISGITEWCGRDVKHFFWFSDNKNNNTVTSGYRNQP